MLRSTHGVLVVFDDEDHRKFPKRRHIECLVDLTLVRGTIAEIGKGNVVIALVFVGKGDTGPEGDVRAHNAVATVEFFLFREHMHGATLATGIPAFAARQLGHHAVWIHPAGQHMPVVAIGGDAAVAVLGRGLKPDNHGFLPDIKVTEAPDQAHAVELAGFFFEAPDQQHIAIIGLKLFGAGICLLGRFLGSHGAIPPYSCPAHAQNSLALNYLLSDSSRECERHLTKHITAQCFR